MVYILKLLTYCHRGGNRIWPDRDSKPGPLPLSLQAFKIVILSLKLLFYVKKIMKLLHHYDNHIYTWSTCSGYIRKTCLCKIYPLKPHFCIAKLGFEGVHLIFLFLIQNIHCGFSLEPPWRGSSNVYPQCMF